MPSVSAGGVQKSSTTSWYTYDGANRVAVSDGDLVDGTIVVANRGTSYVLSYDAAGNAAVMSSARRSVCRFATISSHRASGWIPSTRKHGR